MSEYLSVLGGVGFWDVQVDTVTHFGTRVTDFLVMVEFVFLLGICQCLSGQHPCIAHVTKHGYHDIIHVRKMESSGISGES